LPVYTPAKPSEALALKTASFVSPLRGFSQPDWGVKADSRAPKWITDLLSKFQNKDKASRHVSKVKAPAQKTLETAAGTRANPIEKLSQLTDRNFGFVGVLMSLSVLILILLLSMVRPSRRTHKPQVYSK